MYLDHISNKLKKSIFSNRCGQGYSKLSISFIGFQCDVIFIFATFCQRCEYSHIGSRHRKRFFPLASQNIFQEHSNYLVQLCSDHFPYGNNYHKMFWHFAFYWRLHILPFGQLEKCLVFHLCVWQTYFGLRMIKRGLLNSDLSSQYTLRCIAVTYKTNI